FSPDNAWNPHLHSPWPHLHHQQQFAHRIHDGPHPVARTLKALHGVFSTDLASSEGPDYGVQFIELQLAHVDVTEEIAAKSLELLGGFHQPLQYRVGVNLEHAGRGANAQSFSQTCQHAHDQLHRQTFALQERAVRFQKVAVTRATVQLSP